MTTNQIGGLILAGGVGRRMGMAKLRLLSGSKSFLHCCWRALVDGGVESIVCVVSPEESGWAGREVPEAHIMVNDLRAEEMITSVRTGIQLLTRCSGVLVLPVDHPEVKASTIRALVDAARSELNAVIKPTFRSRAGHPVYLPQLLFPPVLASRNSDTLRGIIASAGVAVRRLEVSDPGVLNNINTPEDLSLLSDKGE